MGTSISDPILPIYSTIVNHDIVYLVYQRTTK